MSTLFISDLHLEDARPEMTEILLRLLDGAAREADALYILGDLFEYWIGDDAQTATAVKVQQGLRALTRSGVPCYFIHGNRDFLLGKEYASESGMEILPDTKVINLYGRPTLLLHGDTLCTDDTEYQRFRRQVRDPDWQRRFLQMKVSDRRKMAEQARDASAQHTSHSAMQIMDTNEAAVVEAFRKHDVEHMIHGHTHRPAFHRHDLGKGKSGKRIVLSDWYEAGSLLRVSDEGAVTEALN